MSARCTTVSTRSWRTSLPIAAWRVSAWTQSWASRAMMRSATAQPNRHGTWEASRRATSAPSGLDTPVTRTRLGRGEVTPRLWVYASHRRRVGYPLDRQRVSSQPHVDALVDRGVEDLVEGPRDDVVQLGVDLLLLPEEGLQVLHPLEIRNDHTARVGDDVRDQEDAALVKDGIRLRRDRGVGALGDEPGTDPSSILLGDLVLE